MTVLVGDDRLVLDPSLEPGIVQVLGGDSRGRAGSRPEASGCGSAAIAVRWRMARAAENAAAGAAVPAAAGGRTCQMPSPASATTTTAVSTAA